MGGTYTRSTCPQCGSADMDCGQLTCKCNKCGHECSKRQAGKYHGSHSCEFPEDTQSVPRYKRGRKRKRDEEE